MMKYILLLLLFLQANSFAVSYYFDSKNGNDNNSGKSENKAFRTLEKLNNLHLHPGDFVYLKRGSRFIGEIKIKYSGTKDNYIIYESYGTGNRPQIDGNHKYGNNIFMEKVSYIMVKSISLLNNKGRGNVYLNECSNVVLDNLDIYTTGRGGIFIENSRDCIVENCQIATPSGSYDKQTDGVYLQRNKRIKVLNNHITLNNSHLTQHTDGVQGYLETDLTVANNFIELNNSKTNAQGIYMTNSFGTNLIFNNVVNAPNTKASVIGFRNLDKGTGAVRIYNNTLKGKSSNMIYASEATDVEIMNNLVISSGSSSLIQITARLKDYTKVNNNYYNRRKDQKTVSTGKKGSIYSGNEWQRLGADTKSIFEITALNEHFKPVEENIGKDKGINLTQYFDYDKDSKKRKGTFDIGAYELD